MYFQQLVQDSTVHLSMVNTSTHVPLVRTNTAPLPHMYFTAVRTPREHQHQRRLALASHVEDVDDVEKQLHALHQHDEECRQVEEMQRRRDYSAYRLQK